MRVRKLWWLGATGVVATLIGVLLAVPALAAPSNQEVRPEPVAPSIQTASPEPDAYTAMHEACEAGDLHGMADAMDALTDKDWQTMEDHMGSGHHSTMGSGMMGSGMMDAWSGQGMMSW